MNLGRLSWMRKTAKTAAYRRLGPTLALRKPPPSAASVKPVQPTGLSGKRRSEYQLQMFWFVSAPG